MNRSASSSVLTFRHAFQSSFVINHCSGPFAQSAYFGESAANALPPTRSAHIATARRRGLIDSSRDLERLLQVVRLLRHGVDDLHFEQIVARRESTLDRLELNRVDDRVLARSRRARERKRRDVAERPRNRLRELAAGELELDLKLRKIRRRIDARVVKLDKVRELIRGRASQ